MALTLGDPVPDVTLLHKDADGVRKVRLREYIGGHPAVILFFPLIGTGVCTKEMCMITEDFESYAGLNARVLGISVDSPMAQQMWAHEKGITVPLFSDFNREASVAFDSLHDVFSPGSWDMHGVSKRSAFVADANGTVIHAEVLDNPGMLPNLDAVKAVLNAIA